MAMAAEPTPKSPPASPDPCGRHRLQLAVDALHREIVFLEGEINSIEGVHAASKCCKEVDEFIGRNADPFITISSEKRNTDQSHHFLKKFRARACLSYLSWICCCGGCSSSKVKRLSCCCCSCGALERLCCCCSSSSCSCCRRCRCRCRVGCVSCCRAPSCCSPCSVQCPRCSCDCACPCPRCSCACPRCSATCCIPRCCVCL